MTEEKTSQSKTPASFLVLFERNLPESRRWGILQAIQRFSWWQKTDYGDSGRLHHERIIVRDAGHLTEAKEVVGGMLGVSAVEDCVNYVVLDKSGSCPNCTYPSREKCWASSTWPATDTTADTSDNAYCEPEPREIVIGTGRQSQTDWERLDQMTDDELILRTLTDEFWKNASIGRPLGAIVGPAPKLPEPKFDIKRRNELFDRLKVLRSEAALNGLSEAASAEMDALEQELEQILGDDQASK